MKVALITTTINVPRVLELYRRCDDSMLAPIPTQRTRFFVAGDLKTPVAASSFCADLPGTTFLSPEFQRSCNYACSELIGWNTVARRNIALLEALKWGADLIVTIDDDNIPLGSDYFYNFRTTLLDSHGGLLVDTPRSWFDPGELLVPKTKHRGFPFQMKSEVGFSPVIGAKVGVAAGLCLGDPDIDACTRIATNPTVQSVTELGRAGVVLDPRKHWTVFNTQNTAFIRELAPAMFCAPGLGRYDDIFASLVTQRVMRERGTHVHFGPPFVHQQRNQHDLVVDLRAEIDGMDHVLKLSRYLDELRFAPGMSVIAQVRGIYTGLKFEKWYPQIGVEAAMAWCDDCERAMG